MTLAWTISATSLVSQEQHQYYFTTRAWLLSCKVKFSRTIARRFRGRTPPLHCSGHPANVALCFVINTSTLCIKKVPAKHIFNRRQRQAHSALLSDILELVRPGDAASSSADNSSLMLNMSLHNLALEWRPPGVDVPASPDDTNNKEFRNWTRLIRRAADKPRWSCRTKIALRIHSWPHAITMCPVIALDISLRTI